MKAESINGRLLLSFGVWKVKSGYGTFPLSKEMQTKPAIESHGSWVGAIVKHGEVTEYHFESESV